MAQLPQAVLTSADNVEVVGLELGWKYIYSLSWELESNQQTSPPPFT